MEYWRRETNPITGAKFEQFYKYMHVAHNGEADIDALVSSAYGAALTENLQTRFLLEEDASGELARKYYRDLGLCREIVRGEDFYERWILLTPLAMQTEAAEKKYPVVICGHGKGNPVEAEEFLFGFGRFAAEEKFITVYPQNTNWNAVADIIKILERDYPVDNERIYLTGYSQGGNQTMTALFHIPEKFAAAAPCGCDVYRDRDNFGDEYTQKQQEHLREVFVPFMQMAGMCEGSSIVPLNDWRPRKDWGIFHRAGLYIDPRIDDAKDPTMNRDGKYYPPPVFQPPIDQDRHVWRLSLLNKRLKLLGCAPREIRQCLDYLLTADGEIHRIMGFYGDQEKVEEVFGYRHYVIDILNADGLNAFRYITVENSGHWVPASMSKMTWEFFKRFRRDSRTGKIVQL